MSLVQKPLGSQIWNPFDPERDRLREELKAQAIRDATKATDAIRADLRRKLRATRVAENKGDSGRGSQPVDSP